jgi:hypothetical protein
MLDLRVLFPLNGGSNIHDKLSLKISKEAIFHRTQRALKWCCWDFAKVAEAFLSAAGLCKGPGGRGVRPERIWAGGWWWQCGSPAEKEQERCQYTKVSKQLCSLHQAQTTGNSCVRTWPLTRKVNKCSVPAERCPLTVARHL